MKFGRGGGQKLQEVIEIVRKEARRDGPDAWTLFNPRGRGSGNSAESSVLDHGLDWLDAGDGLLREGESEGDSPEEFAIDVDRTAAHSLQNPGFGEWTAAQPGDNDGLPWSEILQDSEDLDLELIDPIALENGFSDAAESRADILDWEEVLTGKDRR